MYVLRLILFASLISLLIGTLTDCGPTIEDKDWRARKAAVEKLDDQVLLAKVAIEDNDMNVRKAAVKRLYDQAVLAKVAIEDKDTNVRKAAVEELYDQAVLAKVAIEDKETNVRKAAFDHLGNTIGSTIFRFNLINKLKDSDTLFIQIATETVHETRDAGECLARLKLATQEPRIKFRFPSLRCVANASVISQKYYEVYKESNQRTGGEETLSGDKFTIKYQQNGNILAEASWSTYFPGETQSYFPGETHSLISESVDVIGEDLLRIFLHLRAFTSEDLAELVHSKIPEVRMGAVVNLNDQTELAKVAIGGMDSGVRQAAVENLTDQVLLAKVAIENEYANVRQAATKKVVDQALLLKVAIEDKDWSVRRAAVEKIDNQVLLAKVAIESKYPDLRKAAICKLTDLTVLNMLVTEIIDWDVINAAKYRIYELTHEKQPAATLPTEILR